MEDNTEEQLTLFAGDSPASHSPLRGSAEARTMTVHSGRKCYESYERWSQLGPLAKMCLGSSTWNSTMCYLTWKERVTPANRLLFQLAVSMPNTNEIGSGSLLHTLTAVAVREGTRLWPTPTSMTGGEGVSPSHLKGTHGWNTGSAVRDSLSEKPNRLWPTLTVQDSKNNGSKTQQERHMKPLNAEVRGALNPEWVEWLMGFPAGWTNLEESHE